MRKTNLFYLNGNNSNFLTFSNYTEFLTGVFLSTSSKMYPSSFLAFNLPFDNNTHKADSFKKFLMCYYENKLAMLRDYMNENNEQWEKHHYTLNYLIEAIYKFFGQKIDTTYVGDITEQDYNGMYADTICIIDFNRYVSYKFDSEDGSFDYSSYSSNDMLYGWNANEITDKTIKAIYDNDGTDMYNGYDPVITKVEKVEHKIDDISTAESIKFNCIIPLFDIYDINTTTYTASNEYDFTLDSGIASKTNTDKYMFYKNIPYGIWINNFTDENGLPKAIELNYDPVSKFGESWSLVISSKFSPFPYGVKSENGSDNSTDIANQHTYAELLSQQSTLYNKFNELLLSVTKLNTEMNEIRNSISQITNIENIDSLKKYVDDELDSLKKDIDANNAIINEQLANLKWKNIE